MRSTIGLPPDLHAAARSIARDRGTTLSAAVADLVRRARTIEELWNDDVSEPVAGGWPLLEVDTNDAVDVAAVSAFVRGCTGWTREEWR